MFKGSGSEKVNMFVGIISKNKKEEKVIPVKHLLMKGNIFCRKEMIFDKHKIVDTC
jgi:hypothetical protein